MLFERLSHSWAAAAEGAAILTAFPLPMFACSECAELGKGTLLLCFARIADIYHFHFPLPVMVFKGKQPLAAAADSPTKEEEDPSKAISAPADPEVNGKAGHTGLQQQKQREELHRSSHSQREAAGAGWRSEVQDIPKQKSFM